MKNYILITVIAAFLASCQFNEPTEQKSELASNVQQGVAKEVLQTSNYTYILVDNDGKEIWIAGSKMDAKVGVKYYFIQNMKMENFQSKELNKFFDVVLFVQQVSTDPDSFKEEPKKETDYKTDVIITKQDIKIDIAKGTTSIADLFSNKTKYKGTMLTVKGVVTKYNAGIMGKNWIHLQDGTEKDGHFDLVITTLLNANLGDTLTLVGKVVLDQDFGYGYKYDVLLEDAVKK